MVILAIIIVLSIWGYFVQKKQGKPIGEILSVGAIYHNESILVILLILACLSEGLSAATAFTNDVMHTNVMARICSHLFISIVGIVGTLTFFRDAGSVFEPKLDWQTRLVRICVVATVFVLLVGSPIFNLMLMAGNMKQEHELELFLYSWVSSDEQYLRVLQVWGLDAKYSSWAALQPALKVSIAISFFHFWIGLLEGLRVMASPERRGLLFPEKKKEDKKEEKKDEKEDLKRDPKRESPTPGEERAYKALSDNAEFLLSRLNYRGEPLKAMVKEVVKVLDSVHSKDKQLAMALAAKMASFKSEAHTLDQSNEANKSENKAKQKEKIRQFFTDPLRIEKGGAYHTATKAGLGLDLKGGNPKS